MTLNSKSKDNYALLSKFLAILSDLYIYNIYFQFDIDIVRIGRLGKIHMDIRPFSAETLTAGFRTVQELNDFYLSKVTYKLSQTNAFNDVCAG